MTNIETILQNAVASGAVAGVAAAVTSGEKAIFESVAGVTAIGGHDPMTTDTQFWIASMTKAVTSFAAMQLVEQGKLSLDAPLEDLLPELKNPQIIENGAVRPAHTKITLKHLLTHTAGFAYDFTSKEYAALAAKNPNAPKLGTRAYLYAPLLFEPGARWEYGLSTDWAGLAVEAASGETLEAYFQKHIFEPLGMARSTFFPGLENRAALHTRAPDGVLTAIPPLLPKAQDVFSGGGGLYSTLNDYQKFLRMILNKGAGIVSPETIAAMSVNQIGALRAGLIPTVDPAMAADQDSFPGMDTKWSLAFLINPEPGPFGRSAGSLSWAGLANTYYWIDPAKNIAGLIMMQVLPFGDTGAVKTLCSFEKAVYTAMQ